MIRGGSALAVVLVVGACATGEGIRPEVTTTGPSTTTTTQSTTTTGTAPPSAYGGTVVIGIGDAPSPLGLNPFLGGPDLAVLDTIGAALFARGWIADPESGLPVAEVLEAVPGIGNGLVVDNGDGTMTVTVSVRAGARWGDGVAMSGADLAFTIATAADPDLPIRADWSDLYRSIEAATVQVAGRSVTFRMEAGLDAGRLFPVILPGHDLAGADFAAGFTERTWVAGGPFQVAEFVPGQYLSLERNPGYWRQTARGEPLPYLDRLVVRFYEPGPEEDPRLVEAHRAGDVDVVVFGNAQERAGAYRAVAGSQIATGPGSVWDMLVFQFGPGNRNEASQNRHLDFRRAVAHAIDRDGLAVARGTVPVSSVLGRFGLAPTGAWDRYRFDQDEVAARLFALEGVIDLDPFAGDGLDVSVAVAEDSAATVATAGRLVTMLRDAGFDAELQLEDPATFFGATLDNGSWDLAVWSVPGVPGAGPAADFLTIFDPDGLPFVGDNYLRWGTIDSTVSGDAVDRYRDLVDELGGVVDQETAVALLVQMEEILADQVVIVPLIVRDDLGLAWSGSEVSGPALNPAGGVAWNAALWRRIG